MIIKYPDPILKKKCRPIENIHSPQIKELILEMLGEMKKNNGLGIAAPQVGKLLQLCIIKLDGRTYILLNPKITGRSWAKELGEEGCLSFPGTFVLVKRHKKVSVKALDEKGEPLNIKAEGLLARAFQHEIDHLEGITIEERKLKSKENIKD
ncbi:MAG: peptide deformylase [Patescibacteria group bacterium]